MNSAEISQNVTDLRTLLADFNISTSNINYENDVIEIPVHYGTSKIRMSGNPSLSIELKMDTSGLNTLTEYMHEAAMVYKIRNNTNPAVIDQFEKLLAVIHLTNDNNE